MEVVNKLSNKNETEGPINFIDIVVPSKVLWPNDIRVNANINLLNFLKAGNDPRLFEIFEMGTDGFRSSKYAFRGVVKDNTGRKHDNSWIAEDNLYQLGHEKSGKSVLYISRRPSVSLTFATPYKDNDEGYLMVYDNLDGFFDDSKS